MADIISLGSRGSDGEARILSENEEVVIHLRGDDALLRIGGGHTPGLISVRDNAAGSGRETIRLSGAGGDLVLGGHGTDGDVLLRDGETRTVIQLSARNGVVKVGGGSASGEAGPSGELWIRDGHGQTPIHFRAEDAIVRVGGGGTPGLISVRDNSPGSGRETVRIDGDAGDIVFRNADFAEEFDVTDEVTPGTVMILGSEGTLQASGNEYDTRVVGVISGAGEYKPGIILDRQHGSTNRLPVALVGKVYCNVDANHSPIGVGDLLTTSPTPGHAMKAADPGRAFGAVLGKALSPLAEGTGLIPVVVALN